MRRFAVVLFALFAQSASAQSFESLQAAAAGLNLSIAPIGDLSTWSASGNGSASASGGTASLSASGDDGRAALRAPDLAIAGLLAQVQASPGGSDEQEAGLEVNLGVLPSGNNLRLTLVLESDDGDRFRVTWRLREVTAGGNSVARLGEGTMGDEDNGWSAGQPEFLGYAVIDGEVWIYATSGRLLSRGRIIGGFTPFASQRPSLIANTKDDGDSISASFSVVAAITGG